MISPEHANTRSSQFTIAGWLAGLAYYVWFGPVEATIVEHAILIVGGVFLSSIIIGGGIALLFGILTRGLTGRWDGSPHGYAWGAFIAPVVAFFTVGPTAAALVSLI